MGPALAAVPGATNPFIIRDSNRKMQALPGQPSERPARPRSVRSEHARRVLDAVEFRLSSSGGAVPPGACPASTGYRGEFSRNSDE